MAVKLQSSQGDETVSVKEGTQNNSVGKHVSFAWLNCSSPGRVNQETVCYMQDYDGHWNSKNTVYNSVSNY